MAEEKSRLGRGLAALIGEVNQEAAAGGDRAARGQRKVPIEFVRANPKNPRRHFAEAELDELAKSIRERGIIQPVVVRRVAGAQDAYEIIAGERRWRASQRAGLHDLPIVVIEASDQEALEFAIIENVQRADLSPLEEALGYKALLEEYSHSQEEIGRIVGKSRSHVANTLRLLGLPDSVKAYITEGKLSAGHARALLSLPDPEAVAREVVEKGLNVRAVETIAQDAAARRGAPARGARPRAEKDAVIRSMERRLSDFLGLAVSIDPKSEESGELRIRYKTLDQFDMLVMKLGVG